MTIAYTTSDGYVTDEPDIYSGLLGYGAGVTLGGPQVGLVNHSWLRFVPPFRQGDTIHHATLGLYSWDFGNNAPSEFNTSPILIRAFDEDAATIPTSYADFNSRSKTTAQVLTSLPATAAEQLSTVNVKEILQELADRSGFTGATIVLTIESDVTSTDFTTFASDEDGFPAYLDVSAAVRGSWSRVFRIPSANGRINCQSSNKRLTAWAR